LENDPIAYNFLQLYTMMAMSQQEVPLAEIIPLTYRNLSDRYEDEKKAINLKIANEFHTYPEYQYLSGKTRDILEEIIRITKVLNSFQDSALQNFHKLFMDPFKVTVDSSRLETVEEGIDSIPARDSFQLDKISIGGTLKGAAQSKALYKFLKTKGTSKRPAPVTVTLTIRNFSPDSINILSGVKDKNLFFNKQWLGGKLDATRKKAFVELMKTSDSASGDKVIKQLPIMVFLDGHEKPDDEYIVKLLAAQPNLRAVKFGFGRDRIPNSSFYIVGILQNVKIDGVNSIALDSPSTTGGEASNAVRFIANHMTGLPQQFSPFQFFIRGQGKFLMRYQRESSSYDVQALKDLQELSDTPPFPADTVPLLAEGYQSLQGILDGKKARSDREYSLKMLPSLLNAEFDPILANSWSTLNTYDKFLRNPLSEQQLRAAGLALTRNLNGVWYEDMTIVEMLHQWQADLVDYRNELKRWKAVLFPEEQLRKDLAAYETAKEELLQLVKNTQEHFEDKSRNETFAFQVLQEILKDDLFLGKTIDKDRDGDNLVDREWILNGELEIAAVEDRLFELERKLVAKAPGKGETSPVLQYLEEKRKLDALQKVPYQIDDLEFLLWDLQLQLDKLDRRTASMETKALKSISPIVQITETLSHLMYAIKDDSSSTGWITKDTLNLALFDQEIEPVFTGLLSQQLGQIRTKGSFSIPGLTNFVKLTVQDLHFITAKEMTVDSIKLGFFKTAMFLNLTLNRLLELPLFIDQKRPDRTFSLIDKYPDLAPIPDLSDQALDFIYYANVKDHRHAMSSVIRLFTQISEVVQERRTRETIKLNEEIKQLMADKVMAEAGVKRITEELVEEGGENQDIGKQEAPPISDEPRDRDTSAINRLTAMKKLTEAEVKRTATLLAEKEAERVRKMKKKEKRMAKRSKSPDVLAFLRDYGDFMADLIDADTSTDVNALLKAFADPPGSSQEKRRNYITANLNGYVGVLAGYERLSGGLLRENQEYATFAPTIPVGISFSKMSGKGKKAQSYSLFLSILDLGSLTTYSLDGNVAGESQISFKNVLKPGLQFHWNIKNSPFFLGAGGQLGPQFREFDGKQSQLNSAHFFINFGVDVVIKRLFKLENKPRQKDRIKKKKAS
ncbi:MAG: hypothetical protein KTR30_09665, partial [Saprospiraceae bacterium]|nr:hypothetical protein [Saprospiraceae bacterium]